MSAVRWSPLRGHRPGNRAGSKLLALVCVMALAACGSGPSAEGGYVSGDGSITRISAEQRRPAPLLQGDSLAGGTLDVAAYKGKVIVYNVWGSWCAPCRKEAPALVAAAARVAGTAQFIGINTRDLDPAPAQAFVRSQAITYPNLYDPRGQLLLQFGSQLPPSAIPTTLVLDTQGRLAARVLGEVTEATLVALITEVAEGK